MSASPNTDPSTSALERSLKECLAARASDWADWRERERRLTTELKLLNSKLINQDAENDRLSRETAGLERELVRLQGLDAKLRQESVRAQQLDQQVASLRGEVERLLDEQATLADDLQASIAREQGLQTQLEQALVSLDRSRRQLEAAGEPDRFLPEGLLQLLRARAGLPLSPSAGLNAHLAQPASLPLEVIYTLLRLHMGGEWQDLRLSGRLEQALEDYRRQGG